MELKKLKILLGMSGGIDSTYAAMKLMRMGHEVTGAVLVMHDYTDVAAAERAASRLNIPLVHIDCREAFDREVKDYFVSEYTSARTPNPCIVCNREVKFRYLYEYAAQNSFDRIATGHYARIAHCERYGVDRYAVMNAEDPTKDQTYVLYRLPQHILASMTLPLGDELKSNVKRLAHEAGIDEEGQKESQEICFIPDDDYRGYIESRIGKFPEGNFIDEKGRVLGTHKGIISYTVGQRKGLGISLGERVFVSHIDPVTNEITVATSAPKTERITVNSVVFSGIPEQPVGTAFTATVKIRYKATEVPSVVRILEGGRAEIFFDEPVGLVAPGQSAVAYKDGVVLLGGFID